MSRRHKYNAKKTVIDGITFDSRAEAAYYNQLKILKKQEKLKVLKCKRNLHCWKVLVIQVRKQKEESLQDWYTAHNNTKKYDWMYIVMNDWCGFDKEPSYEIVERLDLRNEFYGTFIELRAKEKL